MILKEDLQYPILLAEEVEGQLQVYCPYCASIHYHGDEGVKVSHCRREDSPFILTGYKVIRKKKFKDVRRQENEYPRLRIGMLEEWKG